jgi:hypothetical protein
MKADSGPADSSRMIYWLTPVNDGFLQRSGQGWMALRKASSGIIQGPRKRISHWYAGQGCRPAHLNRRFARTSTVRRDLEMIRLADSHGECSQLRCGEAGHGALLAPVASRSMDREEVPNPSATEVGANTKARPQCRESEELTRFHARSTPSSASFRTTQPRPLEAPRSGLALDAMDFGAQLLREHGPQISSRRGAAGPPFVDNAPAGLPASSTATTCSSG